MTFTQPPRGSSFVLNDETRVLAVSVFTLLTVLLTWVNARWPRARSLTHRVAVVVVDDGEPVPDVMRAERLSLDDLMAAVRGPGYERFSEIRLAVLEANGQLSFFGTRGEGASSPPGMG